MIQNLDNDNTINHIKNTTPDKAFFMQLEIVTIICY